VGGDQTAFREFHGLTRGLVFRTVQAKLLDAAQAEEVTQEVFLEIWSKADDFNAARGSVLTWVATIARRRAIDRVRAAHTSRSRELREGIRQIDIPYDQVSESVELALERGRLIEALDSITLLQREALVARYLEGRTVSDAARAVGASESAMKARLLDGLTGLRALLAA
jgi:RNA polymerase sigma-70 factor (ECF subfamily)